MSHNEQEIWSGRPCCCSACGEYCGGVKWNVTNHYIERESGCCCLTIDSFPVKQLSEVKYKGSCCCCCGCGDIDLIFTSTTHPVITMRGIKGGERVYEHIRNMLNDIQGK